MAGNSERKGAIRKGKKGPTVGSGGQRRKQLKGRGPTPKASERDKHVAARRARSAAKGTRRPARAGKRPSSGRGRSAKGGPEYVVGRNSVVDSLTAQIPATALYVAERIDADERVRHAVDLANEQSLPVLEAPRIELDRLADGLTHQGLILQVPPYEYAHADDLLERAADARETPLIVALDHVTDPAQPRRSRAVGGRLRCARRPGAGPARGQHDGVGVEDRVRCGSARPGGTVHQPVAGAGRLPQGRALRRRAGRRR